MNGGKSTPHHNQGDDYRAGGRLLEMMQVILISETLR